MSLSKRVSVYMLMTMISKGVGFLLLPLYTKYLVPADYGALAIIDTIGMYFGIFVAGGLGTALVRFYKADEAINNSVVFTSITTIVSGLFLLLLFFAYIFLLSFDIESINSDFVLIALIYIGFDTINSVYIRQMVVDKNDKQYLVIGVLRLCISVPMNIILIAYYELGILGFLYANVCSSIFIWGGFSLPYFYKNFILPEKKYFQEIIKYSLPYIPTGLLEALFSSISIIMLTYYTDTESVGLFAIGVKLASILLLTSTPIQNIWIPYMFSIKDAPDNTKYYTDGFRQILLVLFSVSILLVAASGMIFYLLVDNKFAESLVFLPVLLLSNCLYMLRGTARIGLAISDDVKKIPMITLFSILISLPFFIIFIEVFGVLGAAYGQLLLSVILVSLLLIYSNKHVKILVNLLSILIPSSAILLLPFYFKISVGFELINPIIIVLCYCLSVYFLGGLTKKDKNKLKKIIKLKRLT